MTIDEECVQFPTGTRSREICMGDADLTPERINRFRAMHNLPPLIFESGLQDSVVIKTNEGVVVRQLSKTQATKIKATCCSGAGKVKETSVVQDVPVQAGPGTSLINIFKAAGFETCPACLELATKMDAWGVIECKLKLNEIVLDILPRALAWEYDKIGWWAKVMPEAVTVTTIKALVNKAITAAKKKSDIVQALAQDTPMSKVIGARRASQATDEGRTYAPLCTQSFSEDVVKHFLYHILPLGGEHQWALDKNIAQVCEGLQQFNGKKIIAIATPELGNKREFKTPEYVMQAFENAGYTDIEYLVVTNKKPLREVVSFVKLLSRVETLDPNEVVFYGHCKGVTHADPTSICHTWADIMYETVYNNWEQVKSSLEKYGITGSFKKYGTFKTLHNHRWHYSGTFYWFRSASVFIRNWSHVDQTFYGTESWPGYLFRPDEGGCLFHDNTGDLYRVTKEYLQKQLQEWKAVQVLAQKDYK